MRAGGGHSKGAEFERTVSKALSKWATRGERDDVFWRTPGSGSRATRVPAVAHGGDICATHEIGRAFCTHVCLELKCYKKIDWRHLLIDRCGEFYKFWIKLATEARIQSKVPLFVAKENARDTLLITDVDGTSNLFHSHVPLIITTTGMHVHALEHLLEQSYEAVCARLQRSS